VEIHSRAWNATNDFILCNASDELMEFLSDKTPPVCVQGNLNRRMIEDSWCPLDSVYFGH